MDQIFKIYLNKEMIKDLFKNDIDIISSSYKNIQEEINNYKENTTIISNQIDESKD